MVCRKFISNRNEKETKAEMKKSVQLGLSILEISKTIMFKVSAKCKMMLHE